MVSSSRRRVGLSVLGMAFAALSAGCPQPPGLHPRSRRAGIRSRVGSENLVGRGVLDSGHPAGYHNTTGREGSCPGAPGFGDRASQLG